MLDLLTRNMTSLEDFLVVVNVVDKAIQRIDALHQAFFHAGPFMGRDDAGNQVKRNQALGTGTALIFFTIHGKGDTDAAENHFRFLAPFGHHVAGLACQPLIIDFVVVTNLLTLGEKLVGQFGVHLVKFLHKSSLTQSLLMF